PGVLDISVMMYYKSWSKVVGYTFEGGLTVWVNHKFFGSPKNTASNLLHEASHQLGYFHNGAWAKTVPYTMNRIVEELWDELCGKIEVEWRRIRTEITTKGTPKVSWFKRTWYWLRKAFGGK